MPINDARINLRSARERVCEDGLGRCWEIGNISGEEALMDISKVTYFLNNYPSILGDEGAFRLGNCYVQLGDFLEAQRQYERSIVNMFGTRPFWKIAGQVDLLVDTCVLSGREDLLGDVLKELELYKKIPNKGNSALAMFAYGLTELLVPSGWDLSNSIKGLLKKPKWKITYAAGQVLQSITDGNSLGLNSTLPELLKAHEGSAKHGELRETAEGLICMQAMALAYAALKRKLKIEIENEYFSKGYLEFLLSRTA